MDLEHAKRVLSDFFSDRSRTQAETREGLEALKEDIDELLACLPQEDED